MLTRSQIYEFLLTLSNPRWVEPGEKGPILLDGLFNGGRMEFFASATDAMDYGRETYQKALNGDYGEIAPYDPATIAKYEQNQLPDKTEPDIVPDPTPVSDQKDLF